MGPMDVYTDQEADRLSRIMVNDPHFAADELRGQLQQLDPQTASVLIAKTKNDEYVGGLGDLQIQVEFNQQGYDSGYRNVTMATQNGVEQIAELQAQPPAYGQPGYMPGYGQPGYDPAYAPNPLGFVAGVIVGDLLWQRGRGIDFDDDRYRGWSHREQDREQYWNQNGNQFAQNWANPNYRQQYQDQNWQSGAYHPTTNNTYVTNNRYDNTTVNRPVNTTIINETINNTQTNNIRNQQTFNHTMGNAPRPTLEPAPNAGNRQPINGGQPRHDVPVAVPAPGLGTQQRHDVPATVPPLGLPQHREQPAGINGVQPGRLPVGGQSQIRPGLPQSGAERAPIAPAADPNAALHQQQLREQAIHDQQVRDNAARAAAQNAQRRPETVAPNPALQHPQVIERQPAAAPPAARIERQPAAAPPAQHIEARPPAPAAHVEQHAPAQAPPPEKKKP